MRDPHRCRRRLGDGRLQPSETAATGQQSAAAARRVPAVRPRGGDRLCDLKGAATMAGDYTRLRFDPRNDGAGILQQQGRVMLDQDWNEQVELVRRRIRAGTLDTLGAGVVPLQTPEGFHIQLTANNDLTIGVGRIYVDGLLAENHGTGPVAYDAKLDEQVGSQPTPYEQQPYLPTPWTLP